MAGAIVYARAGAVANVTLVNPGKHNAIDIAMWGELRALFERLQAIQPLDAPRVIVVKGDGGQFASGGDIAEFATFRFDPQRLHDFHEHVVAPALCAMLDCDIPLIAKIDGACIGGGLEIAACCDIRLGGASSRYGAPIAKLGFPMAPSELAILARVVPIALLRSVLLEAQLIDADVALRAGILHAVVDDAALGPLASERAERIATLSPQAARLNKRSFRQLARGGPDADELHAHFSYADSTDHREGIAAFLDKRTPRF